MSDKRNDEYPFPHVRHAFKDEFGRFFDVANNMLGGSWGSPHVDVEDFNDKVKVTADLPGYNKSSLSVSIDGNHLILTGSRPCNRPKEVLNNFYTEFERPCGHFTRTLQLPRTITSEGVTTSFNQGVLEINIPKKTPDHLSTKISIN
eukprot:TRINITY_DN1474_c0_g1_i1.p1 TRINITY_DN1474_c0_g1~~TRINITY_DN1474_c0_g1_i1.p1  ORF type:complete len:162 (-),score=54.07 TRINITY_DN1474_c0_g1_i1:221-661(-)